MLSETPAGHGRARQASWLDPTSLVRALLLGLVLVIVTSVVLLVDLAPSKRVLLNEGDVSPRDILAPSDLTYESALRTQQAEEAQARSVQDIYDPPDASVARAQEVRAQQILEYIGTVRQDTIASSAEKASWLATIPDLSLSEDSISRIFALDDGQWQQVRDETIAVLLRAMQGEIRDSQLDDVRRELPTLISYGLTGQQADVVRVLVSGLVKANAQMNVARTEEARRLARDSTLPVTATIRRGEAIVRAGDRVTALDIEALDAFGLRQQATPWQSMMGTILFSLSVVALLVVLITRFQPTLWKRLRTAVVVLALIALFLVMAKLMIPNSGVVPYLYPLPALSMILTILFGPALGMAAGVGVAAIGAFIGEGSIEITIYLLAGTLMGAMALGRAERLTSFLQAGLVVAGTNVLVIFVFGLLGTNLDLVKVAIDGLAGAVMGGLAASLTLAAFLALSAYLELITPFQLAELTRPTHPLFRQLLLKAPGTYHHTLLVSNMAEEAANRIGADSLLARVGAYYHDVGKTVRPYFFAENRTGEGDDPHARLDPRSSAQIVVRHVQDGLDLAEKYKLPVAIRAFIPEHQGTGLALSFYRQAVKEADGKGETVLEEDFRYPGPKPQSRETAIVMLADGCEARVRSLKPASVEEMDRIIRDTIKARADAGELDECDLTLRDLETLRAAFLDVLQGVFHPRVQYPDPVKVKGPDGQEIVR
jgi:putative nucleotidyltransferase with HDIG domain